jgi:hypothetical protein
MSLMKKQMIQAQTRLMGLLEKDELTRGLYVRVHGDHLIIGRGCEPGTADPDDRVRLTRISAQTYGLSVMRHTGRWEKTPFSGTMKEMIATISEFMQHLIAEC